MFKYDPAVEAMYDEGKQFTRWWDQYCGHFLFCRRMLGSKEIPHSGPLRHTYFFNEFFIGTQYLDAGYEALVFYRKVEDEACYQKVTELFGGIAAAQFIAPNGEKGGRAPDLIIFDPRTNNFRFVECKREIEQFTKPQVGRFVGIERYLNTSSVAGKVLSNPNREDLFPPLAPGEWIHIARISPRSPLQ